MLAAQTHYLNGWLLGLGFFGFIFLGFLSGFVRAIQSLTWPQTTGTVVESKVQRSLRSSESSSSESYHYTPFVRYTYEVDGKKQESKQIGIGVISGSEEYAAGIVAKYPVKATVQVYHHPRKHYLAVLKPGGIWMPLVATLISGVVVYFLIGIWLATALHPRKDPWEHARKITPPPAAQ